MATESVNKRNRRTKEATLKESLIAIKVETERNKKVRVCVKSLVGWSKILQGTSGDLKQKA